MWELDYQESWAPKNWCFWTVVLEKTLESPLDCKTIQPVHSKVDQSWVFFGRNDAKAETPVLWPPHVKSWLIGKDSDAGRDWGQEEKWTTEDEMAGWHHWLDGCEFEWWTWVWVNSGSWWWTGRSGVLQFMGSQRVGHDWATELTEVRFGSKGKLYSFNRAWRGASLGPRVGVPNLWDLMPDDLRWIWYNTNRNKVHNKCKALEPSWNYPLAPSS